MRDKYVAVLVQAAPNEVKWTSVCAQCGMKTTSGSLVYSAEYSFPVSLIFRREHTARNAI
jgi:hypothetical protein